MPQIPHRQGQTLRANKRMRVPLIPKIYCAATSTPGMPRTDRTRRENSAAVGHRPHRRGPWTLLRRPRHRRGDGGRGVRDSRRALACRRRPTESRRVAHHHRPPQATGWVRKRRPDPPGSEAGDDVGDPRRANDDLVHGRLANSPPDPRGGQGECPQVVLGDGGGHLGLVPYLACRPPGRSRAPPNSSSRAATCRYGRSASSFTTGTGVSPSSSASL